MHIIKAQTEHVLCYDLMKKNSNYQNKKINYNGRKFVTKSNTDNGEVDGQTVFHYFQKENVIWAEYKGGEIKQGFLIGTAAVALLFWKMANWKCMKNGNG